MFDTIFEACKTLEGRIPMAHFQDIISTLEDLTSHFSEDYFKEKDMRNAVIDAICEILQKHKD